ncbi:MAG: superoxide dismutase family protein [Halorhodospira sp.]
MRGVSRKLVAALALGAVATAAGADEHRSMAEAEVLSTDGETLGTATFRQGPTGVMIRLELEGLSAGERYHGVHIHGRGDCSDPAEGFQASGGHLNPQGQEHGLLNAEGPDAGDLANIYADSAGAVHAELFTALASLDGSVGAQILDEDGAALVIHEQPDDHESQPIGGAGARIACGEIEAR